MKRKSICWEQLQEEISASCCTWKRLYIDAESSQPPLKRNATTCLDWIALPCSSLGQGWQLSSVCTALPLAAPVGFPGMSYKSLSRMGPAPQASCPAPALLWVCSGKASHLPAEHWLQTWSRDFLAIAPQDQNLPSLKLSTYVFLKNSSSFVESDCEAES